jgi:hypothetical protein
MILMTKAYVRTQVQVLIILRIFEHTEHARQSNLRGIVLLLYRCQAVVVTTTSRPSTPTE